MKNQKRVKRKKFYVTSLVLPNYHTYKKDVNGYKNSSHCFPDDFINRRKTAKNLVDSRKN